MNYTTFIAALVVIVTAVLVIAACVKVYVNDVPKKAAPPPEGVPDPYTNPATASKIKAVETAKDVQFLEITKAATKAQAAEQADLANTTKKIVEDIDDTNAYVKDVGQSIRGSQ